jgi:hypothetical protein
VTVHPNNESLEKIRELQAEGLKNIIKKDDDGYLVTFSRPVQKTINGVVRGYTPPVVLNKDGTPFVHGDVQIGNGSDGTVKLEVYQHKTPGGGKAKAARWEALRIDNLVPFKKERDFPADQQKSMAGLEDQPEQLF